jgi:zeaxanthin glucosyltransferase
VYASLGTLQNGSEAIFRAIAQACDGLGVQLVLSLGGGLEPERLGALHGDPIVVKYAPQLQLIERATLVITHAGLNTVLESLAAGVPMVALPQANDQPGVASRTAAAGAGLVLTSRRLNVARLRETVRRVLVEEKFRAAAKVLQASIAETDGLGRAADIIENALRIRAHRVTLAGD